MEDFYTPISYHDLMLYSGYYRIVFTDYQLGLNEAILAEQLEISEELLYRDYMKLHFTIAESGEDPMLRKILLEEVGVAEHILDGVIRAWNNLEELEELEYLLGLKP
jgi:hypothetical protein